MTSGDGAQTDGGPRQHEEHPPVTKERRLRRVGQRTLAELFASAVHQRGGHHVLYHTAGVRARYGDQRPDVIGGVGYRDGRGEGGDRKHDPIDYPRIARAVASE